MEIPLEPGDPTFGEVRDGEDSSSAPRRVRLSPWNMVLIAAALAACGIFTVVAIRHFDQKPAALSVRVTGIPAAVSTPLANLMALSPVPNKPAPNFTLTDQNGHTMSLAFFKGHAVVLEFMDPHCVDICPIVSQEFVDASHDLGATAPRVVFLAVNVNIRYSSVSAVQTYSREHRLDTIPTWHFFTGASRILQSVWRSYGVAVEVPHPNADIVHTSIVYFIDSEGRERFIAVPSDNHTEAGTAFLPPNQLVAWGQGIAIVARQLLK